MDEKCGGSSRRIATIGIYIAIILGAGYSLFMVPWIEFVTVLVFSAGYTFNSRDGAFIGGLSMGIYAFLNPLGSSPLPIYISQVTGMAIIGFTGGISQRLAGKEYERELIVCIGVLLTLMYDIMTNLAIGFTGIISLEIAFLSGLPIMVLHMATNGYFFAFIPFIVKKTVTGNET